jgi:phosphopantetheine--protein transferase-like protein
LIIEIANIEDLKQEFGFDKTLSQPKNVSILAKKLLIKTLKTNGLFFDFTIGVKEKGKPFFINNKEVCFSISHSKHYVAIVIDNQEVGADIEEIRQGKKSIAERFFAKEENDYLNNYKEDAYDKAFTQLWTMKESFVKQNGEGIADNFNTKKIVPKQFSFETTISYGDLKIYSKFIEDKNLFFSICYSN